MDIQAIHLQIINALDTIPIHILQHGNIVNIITHGVMENAKMDTFIAIILMHIMDKIVAFKIV